ncbi:BrnT family toxin [Paraburkholderia sp. IW21]|uniref:BrnT family toxin n=1 Tax=Paraburkholderia sp. IW21 TaxID=3242488 RepID=UPI0035203465
MYKRQYRWRVRFEWDETKNQINIRKHGIDFRDAIDVFNHPVLTAIDEREDYGEDRWIALGWMAAIVGVVVYVERNVDVIRVVSARKATKHEVRRYKHSVWN